MAERGIIIAGQEIDPVLQIFFNEEGVAIYNGFHDYEYSYDEFMAATYYEVVA